MIKLISAIAIGLIIGIVITGGLLLQAMDDKALYQVQAEKVELWCQMADSYRQIPAYKVTDFNGYEWTFDNGSATRCSIL